MSRPQRRLFVQEGMGTGAANNEAFRARQIRRRVCCTLLYTLLSLGLLPGRTVAASFTATVEPETISVGDTAALNLAFEGSGQIQLSPVPTIPGLVVSGPQQGSETTVVNGQKRVTYRVTYFLRPTRTNTFTIPSLTARIGAETFNSPPLTLQAVRSVESPLSQGLAALRLVLPRDQLYVGETVVAELQLLLDRNASNPSEFNLPDLSGDGWLAGQPVQGKARQAQYGDQIVQVIPIQIPLTPLSPGTVSLGPVTSSVVVRVPSPRRRGDPFGDFGLGFFQRGEARRVPLSLPAQPVQILPLPSEGAPKAFTGSIGQFDMSVSAGPTNVTVGDPVTLRVRISGAGNLNSVSLPEPLVTGDFKTYEPESRLEVTDDFGLEGAKTIEQILIPENTEVREVPGIAFSYFDPEAGAYRTLTRDAIPLVVMPAGSRPSPLVLDSTTAAANPVRRDDIVHIKQHLDAARPTPGKAGSNVSFLAWNSVALFAWLGVFVWRKQREARQRNPRLQRAREVQRVLKEGFDSLDRHAAEAHSEAFFSTVFRMLQEQIGLMLDQPASGITESVIDERLVFFELGSDTIGTLRELFQACDAARYAPVQDRQELAAIVPKLRTVMGQLQEVGL